MTIITLEELEKLLPPEIKAKLDLKKGEKLVIEAINKKTIHIKPIENNDADKKLLELLNNPVHMGKIKGITREDIYSDID